MSADIPQSSVGPVLFSTIDFVPATSPETFLEFFPSGHCHEPIQIAENRQWVFCFRPTEAPIDFGVYGVGLVVTLCTSFFLLAIIGLYAMYLRSRTKIDKARDLFLSTLSHEVLFRVLFDLFFHYSFSR